MVDDPRWPVAEVSITRDLVRALLTEQHPDLAGRDLADPIEGFDMAVVRLGDDLAVRLPRHRASTGSLEAEIRWVGLLQDGWTFPTQRIIRVGHPSAAYPWRWAITTWLPGRPAAFGPLDPSEAVALGRALAEVHQPAPGNAPFNPEQSIPLAEREAVLVADLSRLPAIAARRGLAFDRDAARDVWDRARAVPDRAERVWIHADLHPFNVISLDGHFAGIIDWSDISGGDAAVDLGYLQLLFPSAAVPAAYDEYGGVDQATAARAAGIALGKAAGLAASSNPIAAEVGWRALAELGVAGWAG